MPKAALAVPVTFSFKRPAADKDVVINVNISDAPPQWTNKVIVKLSSHIPVSVNLTAKSYGSANGYVVTPGRTLQKLSAKETATADQYSCPTIAGDSYELVIANPSITGESYYSVGFATSASTTSRLSAIRP